MGWFKRVAKAGRCVLTGGTSACAGLYEANVEKEEPTPPPVVRNESTSPAKIAAIFGGIVGTVIVAFVASMYIRKRRL